MQNNRLLEREARIPSIAILLLASLVTLLIVDKHVVDDAYITFRYTENLLRGEGLVFNSGERVEGYTNFLFTVLLALAGPFGIALPYFAVAIGVVCALSATVLGFVALRQMGVSTAIALASMLALALNPPFWRSATMGLEGSVVALLLVAMLLAFASRRHGLLGILGGLTFTVRPEFLVLIPICVACLWVFGYRSQAAASEAGGGNRRLAIVASLPGWIVVVGALTAFRLAYYGEPLPNTLKAKALDWHNSTLVLENLFQGGQYILAYLLESPLWIAGLAAGIAIAIRERNAAVAAFVVGIFFQFFVVMVNGGDWMPHHRLLTVYDPVLCIFLGLGLQRLAARHASAKRHLAKSDAVVRLCGAGLLLAGIAPGWAGQKLQPSTTVHIADGCYSVVVPNLKRALEPSDKVALDALGIGGYLLMGQYIYDLWGLTDRETARVGQYGRHLGRVAPGYHFERVRSNAIVIHGTSWQFELLQRASDGRFARTYKTYRASAIPTCGQNIFVALRNEDDARLKAPLSQLGLVPLSLDTASGDAAGGTAARDGAQRRGPVSRAW